MAPDQARLAEPVLGTAAASASATRSARLGLVLGGVAVLFWSFGSSLIFLGAQQAGTWPFVAIAALVGGGSQLIGWRLYRGGLRSAVWLPWRLWAVSLPCFVLYGLVWPWALVSSSAKQVFGVSLINYLWPVLTVLLSAWWVPKARLTTRTVLATFLAVAGLVCANLKHIQDLLAAGDSAGGSSVRRFLPYVLALLAAVTWAVYSTLLARWRDWARNYVTSPVGFLLTGTIACAVTAFTGSMPANLSAPGTLTIICYGAGPLAVGYLLWEIALSKARVHTLSLLAAATPVLSTFILCCFLRTLPGPELIFAALLVGGGVLLSARE
jgi:drug/metabolite transporter (DMT)-like permease